MNEELKQFVRGMSEFISDCGQWNKLKEYLLDNFEMSSDDVDRLEGELDNLIE